MESNKHQSSPNAQQQLFMSTAITLSWQLLIVVLAPSLGGHYADQHYGTTPIFTLIGLAVALLMAGLLTYRGYKLLYNDHQERTASDHDKPAA